MALTTTEEPPPSSASSLRRPRPGDAESTANETVRSKKERLASEWLRRPPSFSEDEAAADRLDDKVAELRHAREHDLTLRRAGRALSAAAAAVGRRTIEVGSELGSTYLVPAPYEKWRTKQRSLAASAALDALEREARRDRSDRRASMREETREAIRSRGDVVRAVRREDARSKPHRDVREDHEAKARQERIDEFLARRAEDVRGRERAERDAEREREEREKVEEKRRRYEAVEFWTGKAEQYRAEGEARRRKSERKEREDGVWHAKGKCEAEDGGANNFAIGMTTEDEANDSLIFLADVVSVGSAGPDLSIEAIADVSASMEFPTSADHDEGSTETFRRQKDRHPMASIFRSHVERSSQQSGEPTKEDGGLRGRTKASPPPLSPEVKLFSKTHRTKLEEKRSIQMDEEMREGAAHRRAVDLEGDVARIDDEIGLTRSIKARLAMEEAHCAADEAHILERQRRPIRRDPTEEEVLSMHAIKERRRQIRSDITSMDDAERWLGQERLEKGRLARQFEVEASELEDRNAATRGELSAFDNERSDLPMIVGRNLSKVMDPMTAQPARAYEIIVQSSKFETLRHVTEEALRSYRSSSKVDEELWGMSSRRRDERVQLEDLQTRLARVEDRLRIEKEKNLREDVNGAVMRFWEAGRPLYLTGRAERHDDAPVTADKDGVSSNPVLTDFVKRMRIDEQVGGLRVTNLIAELIRASKSDEEYWDSGALFGVHHRPVASDDNKTRRSGMTRMGPRVTMRSRMDRCSVGGAKCFQRYRKAAFVEQVRREIDRLNRSLEQSAKRDEPKVSSDADRSALQESERRYLERKRELHREAIDRAKELQGCHVEVLDGQRQGHLIVGDVRVRWKENGTRPVIEHFARRGDDRWDPVGDGFFVDLCERSYFVIKQSGQERTRTDRLDLGSSETKRRLRIPNFDRVSFGGRFAPTSGEPRLEKERHEMSETQNRFYDFDVTDGVYRIGRRHGTLSDEINRAIVPLDVGDFAGKGADCLLLGYRLEDSRRRAAFHRTLDVTARVNNFRIRIRESENRRSGLLAKRARVTDRLSWLRQRMLSLEERLRHVERDFDEATRRIDTAERTRLEFRRAVEHFETSTSRKESAAVALVEAEVWEDDARAGLVVAREKVGSVLRRLLRADGLTASIRERSDLTKECAAGCRGELKIAEDEISLLRLKHQGGFVHTRFGPKRVLFHRIGDDMLCVRLAFGKRGTKSSMLAKMYVPVAECLERELASQKRAELAMLQEENLIRRCGVAESARIEADLAALAKEDVLARDVTRESEIETHELRMLADHRKDLTKKARRSIWKREVWRELRDRRRKAYVREKSKRLNEAERISKFDNKSSIVRSWENFKLRVRTSREESALFVEELSAQMFSDSIPILTYQREERVCTNITDDVLATVLTAMVQELCAEALLADTARKDDAIKKDNLVFTSYPFLSFEAYSQMCKLWLAKKTALKGVVSGTPYENTYTRSSSLAELKQDIERRKQNAIMEKRIAEVREGLAMEDAACHRFYRFELQCILRANRSMMSEERDMRLFLKEEEIERAARANRLRELTSFGPKRESAKEARRGELKRGGVERRKMQKELARMHEEDLLSQRLREEERKEEQLRMLREEMAFDLDPVLQDAGASGSVEIDSYEVDEDWYESARQDAVIFHASKELELMERIEEEQICEEELKKHEEELRDLTVQSKQICIDQMKAYSLHRKMKAELDRCTQQDTEATDRKEQSRLKMLNTREALETAELQVQWMDTSVLTSFHQRWETPKLRSCLHQLYFRQLTDIIVCKAEIEAVENQSNALLQLISSNTAETETKRLQMRSLQRKHRRHELLCLYRSALGQIMFGKERIATIKRAFSCWCRAASWQRGQRRAFELKVESIKQGLTIQQQQQLLQKKVTENAVEPTWLAGHTSRQIKCRRCMKYYTEDHNHERACMFHRGSCDLFRSSGCRQWTCCKKSEEHTGCHFGFHLPPKAGDPFYMHRVEQIRREEDSYLLTLESEVKRVQKNVEEGVRKKKENLIGISDDLAANRNVSNRSSMLKLV